MLAPSQNWLAEGQLLVGAGNAYMQQQSVWKQAAYFGSMNSQLQFYYQKSCQAE